MRTARWLAVLAIMVFSATSAVAAGFRLPMAGAKAMGMGFAFTAQADDPSAIYFNPAGITQLEGQNLMVGMTYVKENGGTFSGTTPLTGGATRTETQKDLNFFIPNIYLTRKSSSGLAYGVGVFSPFGLGQEYSNRDTSIFRNQTTKIDLMTIVVNPTIAYEINGILSVGAGIDYMWGSVNQEVTPTFSFGSFKTQLDGTGDAWGYNFGLLLKPSKNMKVGFSYRSPFHLTIKDGDFTASDNTTAFPSPYSLLLPMGTTKASGVLKLPATAALGVAYTFDRLTVEVDADWTFWSSYKELKITNSSVSSYSKTSRKNWKDVCTLRIGGEYRVTPPLALRAGIAYDPTPVPADTMSPDLPDANRMTYHAGAGYKYGSWTIDASYYYVDKKDRTVNNQNTTAGTGFNGTWSGDAHLLAFDVAYKF